MDLDGDGFVSAACCNGAVCGDDCDDLSRDVHPEATEVCNVVDDDCDSIVDGLAAFCPAGTCIASRCRATGWERVWPTGDGVMHTLGVTVDRNGNAYLGISNGDVAAEFDVDEDGSVDPRGRYVVSIDPVGSLRWAFEDTTAAELVPDVGPETLLVVSGDTLSWHRQATGEVLTRSALEAEPGWDFQSVVDGASVGGSIYLLRRLERRDSGGATIDVATLVQQLDGDGIEVSRVLIDAASTEETPLQVVASEAGVVVRGSVSSGPVTVGTGPAGEVTVSGNFLLRMDLSLSPRWAASELPNVLDMAIDGAGFVAIGGRFSGTYDPPWGGSTWDATSEDDNAFVVVYDADGDYLWDWRHGGPARDWIQGIDFDGRGGVVAAGLYSGTLSTRVFTRAAEDRDGIALLFRATDGVVLDAWHVGGLGLQEIKDVAGDSFGNFVMVGDFDRELDLPSGSEIPEITTGPDEEDAWAIRLADAM